MIVAPQQPGVFHHLEAAGRQSIAVSDGNVAVVWEDNRDGKPRAYVGFLTKPAHDFVVQRLSGNDEAYEPAVAALPDGRFLFAWEEGGQAWARTGSPSGLDPVTRLSRLQAAQVAVAGGEHGVFAAWAEQSGNHSAIQLARIRPGKPGESPAVETPHPVTPAPAQDQIYPSVVALATAVIVAWEDRREGHTVLLYTQTRNGRQFDAPHLLNEQLARRSQQFGRGTGVARVVLTRIDTDRAAAVWLDKRDFEGGYDVYAALTGAGPKIRFGRNEKVQDAFGDNIGQWHAAVAGNPSGRLAAVWDDDRDGSPDIWLSWREASGWSANLAVPGAAAPGALDTSPAIAQGEDGDLHLVWVWQENADSPTQLRYLRGARATGR
jgi:hypothetical protein